MLLFVGTVSGVIGHPVHFGVARVHREPRREGEEEYEEDGAHHGQGQQVKVELSKSRIY